MNKLIIATLFGVFLLSIASLSAQKPSSPFYEKHQIDDFCGTDHIKIKDLKAPDNVPVDKAWTSCGATISDCYDNCTPAIPLCKYRVPVVFTIITDGSGATSLGASAAEVQAQVDVALARCNSYYAGAGIELVQCESPRNLDGTDPDFNSVDLYDFDGTSGDDDDDLLATLDLTNVINIYLAPVVVSPSGSSVCGYAYKPSVFSSGSTYDQRLRTVIKNSCLFGENTTLEHELGHFFGLEHTHKGASNSVPNEAADGSDACNYTYFNGSTYSANNSAAQIGDGVADTGPDPNLSSKVSTQCDYTGTYTPDPNQPLPLNNIMSYSNDFYCSKMIFTSCQLEKIQQVMLNCRDILICTNSTPDVLEANIDICQGSKAPTFIGTATCYNWYASATATTPLLSASQHFQPPMSASDLNTPGSYTYYVEYENDFYDTGFSNTAFDVFNGHPVSPNHKRKAITVTVNGGNCNSTPGNGMGFCGLLNCNDNCMFSTDGANFMAPFSSTDYRTGWAVTSGAGSAVSTQAELDILPASQVFGPFPTNDSDYSFDITCTAGQTDLAAGTYNATPFIAKIPTAVTTSTFSSGTLNLTVDNMALIASDIDVSGLPDNATLGQVCFTLSHSKSGHVSIGMGAPDGMGRVTLVDRVGFPQNRPFGYSSDYGGTYCFEPGASAMPEPVSGVISAGTYAPHDIDFSTLFPTQPNGKWSLSIDSPVGGSSGTLTSWSVTFDVPAITFPSIDRQVEGTFGDAIEFEISMALPVELISFSGKKVGENVLLEWITESENNNSHFLLQRSRDGIFFETLSEIKGAGNSFTPLDYQYLDRQPLAGTNYYRLLTVDFNGQIEGSEIINIDFTPGSRLHICPNPVSDSELSLTLNFTSNGEVNFEIRSINAQLISTHRTQLEQGKNNFNIPVQDLNPGVYFLVLRKEGVEEIERFVKL